MKLNDKMQALVPTAFGQNVVALSSEQVRAGFSKMLEQQGIALIHVAYPAVDVRNHKSLDTLVSQLSSHGFAETANLVAQELPYLVFDDLTKALRIYHEIQKDSIAITASLYFAGLTGIQAEEAIKAKVHVHEAPDFAHH